MAISMSVEVSEKRSLDIGEVFRDISSSIIQYNYRTRPEDNVAIRDCCLEWSKRPVGELTVGAVGGGIVSRLLAGPRQPAAEYCLRQIMNLPTPLGTEAIEVVRAKDQNSHFLREVKELVERPARIAKSAVPGNVAETANDSQPHDHDPQKPANVASISCQQDEPLWSTADPFDLFTEEPSSVQPTQPTLSPGQQLEEKRRKRQEAYRLRREQRRMQQQGVLLDDTSHHDAFRNPSR